MYRRVAAGLLLRSTMLALSAALLCLPACSRQGTAAEKRSDAKVTALCAECGYYAETTWPALMQTLPGPATLAALSPVDGPAYKCPKCGKQTFYAEPIVCAQCGRKFLLTRDAAGELVAKCPGCGWVRPGEP